MFWWRVTRYDPAHRDERGAYLRDTWTMFSQVGETFDGKELTLAECEAVEAAYAKAFLAFARESGVTMLAARGVSVRERGELEEGGLVEPDHAALLVRGMLREDGPWCRLESPEDDFAAHVGWDLYMYIGSEHPCPAATKRVGELGLFAEPMCGSPYTPDEPIAFNPSYLAQQIAEIALLALPADAQTAYLQGLGYEISADQLALQLVDWTPAPEFVAAGWISPETASAIDELHTLVDAASENEALWSLASLDAAPEWAAIRERARAVLATI